MAIRTIAPFLAYEADGGGTGVPLLAKGTPGTVLVAAADTTQTGIVATAYKLSDGAEFTPMANQHGAVEGFRVDIPDEAPGIWFVSGPVASYQPTVEGSRGERGLPGPDAVENDETVGEYMATPGTRTRSETKVLVGSEVDHILDGRAAAILTDTESEAFRSIARNFTAKGELIVNVRDHGAVGNGVADDREAVVSALNAVHAAGGGTLLFPAGTYFWATPIPLPVGAANITIEGRGATLAKRTGGLFALFFAIVSGPNRGYGSGARNITFRGLRVEGSFANTQQVALLAAHHASGLVVEDCVFSQAHRQGHIMDLQGCENVTVQRCTFEGQQQVAGSLYAEAIQVDNSSRMGASYADDPAGYDGIACRNITVRDCQFLPLTIGGTTYPAPVALGSHYGIEGFWQEDIRFLHNTVHASGEDTASPVRGTVHFMSARRVLIEGNTFISNSTRAIRAISTIAQDYGPQAANAGLESPPRTTWAIVQTCDDFRVVGNTFIGYKTRNTSEHVVKLAGGLGRNATNMVVDGNTFRDCAGGSQSENVGAHLIDLHMVNQAKVRNNNSDAGRRTVFFLTCDDVTVTGNTINNNASGGGINGNSSTRVVISENKIAGYHTYAVYCSGVTGLAVANNSMTANVGTVDAAVTVAGGSTRFTVTGNDIAGSGTLNGVDIYGTSTRGIVRSNVIIGATAATKLAAGSTATIDGNVTT